MTYAEELACKMWLKHYNRWRIDPNRKMHELRKKPPGFERWQKNKFSDGQALDLTVELPACEGSQPEMK